MTSYITLMASLPPLGSLFEVKQEPISRLKLEERLKLLHDNDRATLDQIADLIAWSAQPFARDDAAFVAKANQFLQLSHNPTFRKLVDEHLTIRTIVAALRRRQRGEAEPPPPGETWGYGRWVSHIERHWKEPAFHLEAVFPWVVEANKLIEDGDWVGLERLQFSVTWAVLDRLGAGHNFDFEAVMIYLNRWSLVARWSCYNGEAAVKRFRDLVSVGLEQFSDVFSQKLS